MVIFLKRLLFIIYFRTVKGFFVVDPKPVANSPLRSLYHSSLLPEAAAPVGRSAPLVSAATWNPNNRPGIAFRARLFYKKEIEIASPSEAAYAAWHG
jgi:hypothetical protein